MVGAGLHRFYHFFGDEQGGLLTEEEEESRADTISAFFYGVGDTGCALWQPLFGRLVGLLAIWAYGDFYGYARICSLGAQGFGLLVGVGPDVNQILLAALGPGGCLYRAGGSRQRPLAS